MKCLFVCFVVGVLAVGCREKPHSGDRILTEGELPVYSPDGKCLAFQRPTQDGMRLGVLDRRGGGVRWVDGAPGHAAQAAWHPTDGSLVYAYGNEMKTAAEGLKGNTGWNLRVWQRDGRIRTLTDGRVWDYTPSFSSDGKFVYFVSTRGVPTSKTTCNAVFRLPAGGGKVETVLPFPAKRSGFCSPMVSPNGRFLVWSEMNLSETWHLMAARTDRPARRLRLTDTKTVAYAPRWSPCGRYVCFTGFRTGDPGWCVYLIDVRTGVTGKLCEGREPAFSPDGRSLAFVRDGKVVERSLSATDFPTGPSAISDPEPPLPNSLVKLVSPKPGEKVKLPSTCAFGDKDTFYVRMKVRTPKKVGPYGVDPALIGRYAEHAAGFQLLFTKGVPAFSVRNADGTYLPIEADRQPRPDEVVDMIGVRHAEKMYVWTSGGEVTAQALDAGTLALRTPQILEVQPAYRGVRSDFEVMSVEVGRGWPADMPRPPTRKEMFE